MNDKLFPVAELDFILETLNEYKDDLEDKKDIVEKIENQIKTIRTNSSSSNTLISISKEEKDSKAKKETEWKKMYYELVRNPLIKKIMTDKAFQQRNFLEAAYGVKFTLDYNENYDQLETLFEEKQISEDDLIRYRLGLNFLLNNAGFMKKIEEQEEKGL